MTKVTAKASIAAALLVSGFALGTSAIAEDTSANSPQEGTVYCIVTRNGFNWNMCAAVETRRKVPVIPAPGAAGPVPPEPKGEEPINFQVFGFDIEASPTTASPKSVGANVDGGGAGGGGRG